MSKIFSIRNALFLIIFSFLSITIATYIENSQSKKSAWELVYSSLWFELIFYLIVTVLIFNIIHFKMYKKEKIPSFVFHLAFIVIIVGALISKHYGYKGKIFIPLNQTSNMLVSEEIFLTINTATNQNKQTISNEGVESLNKTYTIDNKFLKLIDKYYIKSGEQKIIKDIENGTGVMAFEILEKTKRENFFFEDKSSLKIDNINIYFNIEPKDKTKPYFKIDAHTDKRIQFYSNIDVQTNFEEKLEKNTFHEFHQGIIYNINGNKLLVAEIMTLGRVEFIPKDYGTSAFILDAVYNANTKEIALIKEKGTYDSFKSSVYFDNKKFDISFSRKVSKLPFSIKLNEYKLENYAGSKSIYTYESDVVLTDENIKIEDSIKINKPLEYDFFTIFQTKYENHDATLLSVNYNPAKWLIYVGYILLTLGLLLNLFNKNSRFRQLLDATK